MLATVHCYMKPVIFGNSEYQPAKMAKRRQAQHVVEVATTYVGVMHGAVETAWPAAHGHAMPSVNRKMKPIAREENRCPEVTIHPHGCDPGEDLHGRFENRPFHHGWRNEVTLRFEANRPTDYTCGVPPKRLTHAPNRNIALSHTENSRTPLCRECRDDVGQCPKRQDQNVDSGVDRRTRTSCWKRNRSPPPSGEKKTRLPSCDQSGSMVICRQPNRQGTAGSRNAGINTDQAKTTQFCAGFFFFPCRRTHIEDGWLIEVDRARIDEAPADMQRTG